MTNWLVNGQREGVPPADRGLAYGDGVFETIALRDGGWRFLDYHLERLHAGCGRLGFAPPDTDRLTDELHLARDGARHGTGKIIVTRGAGRRGYGPPPEPRPMRVVGVSPTDARSAGAWSHGIRVRFCLTPMSENASLAGLKTLNRIDSVLARAEWDSPDIKEGLMLTSQGNVACGTMSNFFVVQRDSLLTPALDTCGVHGIMRRVILEEAQSLGIPARELPMSREYVAAATELFVCNSLHGIGPITECEGRPREIGELTTRLMEALAARGVAECAA